MITSAACACFCAPPSTDLSQQHQGPQSPVPSPWDGWPGRSLGPRQGTPHLGSPCSRGLLASAGDGPGCPRCSRWPASVPAGGWDHDAFSLPWHRRQDPAARGTVEPWCPARLSALPSSFRVPRQALTLPSHGLLPTLLPGAPLQPRLAPPAATSRPGVPEVDSWVLRCMPALPAIWEAEAGGSQTGGQPGQRGEPVSKCKRGREREGETEAERRETRPSGGRRAAFNHRVQILGGTRAAAPFTVTGLRTPVPRPEACTAPSSNCAF